MFSLPLTTRPIISNNDPLESSPIRELITDDNKVRQNGYVQNAMVTTDKTTSGQNTASSAKNVLIPLTFLFRELSLSCNYSFLANYYATPLGVCFSRATPFVKSQRTHAHHHLSVPPSFMA